MDWRNCCYEEVGLLLKAAQGFNVIPIKIPSTFHRTKENNPKINIEA